MTKVRVYQLAKELGLENKALLDRLHAVGFEVKSHSSTIDQEDALNALKREETQRAEKAEERSRPTVIRRRRPDTAAEDAAAAATDAAPEMEAHAEGEPEGEPAEQPEYEEAEEGDEGDELEAGGEVEEEPAQVAAESEPRGEAPADAAPAETRAPAVPPVQPTATQQAHGGQPAHTLTRPPAVTQPGDPSRPKKDEPEPISRVVRMIDRSVLAERTPQRRFTRPGGPGPRPGMRPGSPRPGGPGGAGAGAPLTPEQLNEAAVKFGPVKELRVVQDVYGKGKQMVDVTRDRAKKGRTAAKRREEVSRRELLELHGRTFYPQRKKKKPLRKGGRKTEITVPGASKRVVKIDQNVVVGELAKTIGLKVGDIIKKLMGMGTMVTINQSIDFATASVLLEELGFQAQDVAFDESELLPETEDAEGDLSTRAPVVTIMGHVDHGKTSLLDAIRDENVAAGEAGGITQHIGAYSVETERGMVTFLDTPGHEAFAAMRARGAKATDVVVLVVAADDGVMPQTIEAIRHAKDAEVPIIVAVNKIDKPGARPEKVENELGTHGLVPEKWGGETLFVYTSALKKEGIDNLLEAILLQAEVLDLRANPNKPANGVVVESKLDKGRGPMATVLVQDGTLRVGDHVVAGQQYGRVRAMLSEFGEELEEAGPSVPVAIVGLSSVCEAGDSFYGVESMDAAKSIVEHRESQAHGKATVAPAKVTLEEFYAKMKATEIKELKLVIKGDVQGSIEALKGALAKLSTNDVKVNIIHSAVGGITEGDVNLAAASRGQSIIVGFNVRPDPKTRKMAESAGVEIRTYRIIYEAIDEIKAALEGMLTPTQEEQVLGRAEVRAVFTVPKIGTIAGCFVTDGLVRRNSLVRLLRDSVVVFDGKVGSLRRFKDDVREVKQSFECGIGIENYNDVKVGDIIEAYEMRNVARTLESTRTPEAPQSHPSA